jgi:hypothetical protein
MANKAKRAPKPGDKRPALENFRPAMLAARPASEKLPTIYPASYLVKYLPAKAAYGSNTWAIKGGMCGGSTGCCRGVTSNNGTGIVPAAFIK